MPDSADYHAQVSRELRREIAQWQLDMHVALLGIDERRRDALVDRLAQWVEGHVAGKLLEERSRHGG